MMSERESFSLFVDPESLDAEDVHVVGGDVGIDGLEGGIVAFRQRGGFDGRTFAGTHHFVRNSSVCEALARFVTLDLVAFRI